jgi:hypothetical protein
MTSPDLRAAIKALLATGWTNCPVFDLSDYIALDALPIGTADKALLLQFGFSTETMTTIGVPGSDSWQEIGSFYFHLLFPAGDDSTEALAWGEQLRGLFRGTRLGAAVIDSVSPFTDLDGAAIRLNGRWHGWSAPAAYYRVICA